MGPSIGNLLVSENGFPEPGGICWVRPDVRACHDTVVRPLLVVGAGIELFPAELEAFVEVSGVTRVVVAAQDGIIPFEVGRLGDFQLGSVCVQQVRTSTGGRCPRQQLCEAFKVSP